MDIWARFDEVEDDLDSLLKQVAERSFEELSTTAVDSLRDSLRDVPDRAQLTVYRTERPDGSLQIILQAYRQGRKILFLEFGQMLAKGLIITKDGAVSYLAESDLYEFM